jgi:uncharacterized membrane protein YqgA involved in biofilm formation
MFKRFISKTRRIVGGIKEMATFWTSIGVMLVPIGIAILFQNPNNYIIAYSFVIIGAVLGIIGLTYTIRDERVKRIELEKAERRKAEDDKKRDREHYLYILALYEIIKSLGGSPRIVNIKYRRWLEQELLKEEQEGQEESDEL